MKQNMIFFVFNLVFGYYDLMRRHSSSFSFKLILLTFCSYSSEFCCCVLFTFLPYVLVVSLALLVIFPVLKPKIDCC